MALYSRPTTTEYGFTSLPADQAKTPASTSSPQPVPISSLPLPNTPLANRINAYAKHHLPDSTYRHSLRVYSYGLAINLQCYPHYNLSSIASLRETWFLTAMVSQIPPNWCWDSLSTLLYQMCCLSVCRRESCPLILKLSRLSRPEATQPLTKRQLHDIGTTPTNLTSTRLSYEFFAGHLSLQILQSASLTSSTPGCADFGSNSEATTEQAESVAEAIIRHQDVQKSGNITLMTRLIHMGTLLDNIGAGAELVHLDTIKVVNEAYDRTGWGGCFKETVEREKLEKPYAMVSRIEGFENAIEKNSREGVMAKWDQGRD